MASQGLMRLTKIECPVSISNLPGSSTDPWLGDTSHALVSARTMAQHQFVSGGVGCAQTVTLNTICGHAGASVAVRCQHLSSCGPVSPVRMAGVSAGIKPK